MWFEKDNPSNYLIFRIKQVSKLESCNVSSVTLLTEGNMNNCLIYGYSQILEKDDAIYL